MSADGLLAGLTAYELRHLTAHLIASGRQKDLHRLLELEQSDGRIGWFEAKSRGGRSGEYAADVAAAWQAARTARDLPRQVRYTLVSASLHSRRLHLPARLLAACVAVGLVPWTEATSIIEQIPGSSARSAAIEELAPVMPEEGMPFLLDQALALTKARDSTMKALAGHLQVALLHRVLRTEQDWIRGFLGDEAAHELIFQLAQAGEVAEALDLFQECRSVPLALRLASFADVSGDADAQQRLTELPQRADLV